MVLGGGPAGCAAAALLARLGHAVALVRPARPPAGDLAQSIPPSADKLLVELGFASQVVGAGFQRNGGNTVWWAGQDARVEHFEPGRSGVHVERAGLETVLGEAAREAGVRVLEVAARSADESPGGWRVRVAEEGVAASELRAPWVLDATGRSGLVARREGRIADRGTSTLALVRRWRRAGGFPASDPTHTLVESYEDGWAWSVPLGEDVRCFTAMVDHRHADLAEHDLDVVLNAELDKAAHVGSVREGGEPIGPAWACPASLYSATRFGRQGLLLVGDAGSFIDPLSSFGVKKALSSGWLAGITVHTALTDPATAGTAVDFFDAREREVYRRYRARSVGFFGECARVHGHAYWVTREKAAAEAAGNADPSLDPDGAFGHDVPEGLARVALERIRSLPSLRALPGASLRTVERPTVVGHRIERRSHLASNLFPAGLRYVRNVDLARVVEIAPGHAQVPDGWEAYNAGAPDVSLPDYLAALATAFAAGLLEHADGP